MLPQAQWGGKIFFKIFESMAEIVFVIFGFVGEIPCGWRMTWKICMGIGCGCAGGSGCGCSVECNPGLCEGFLTCGCEYPWCGCVGWDR